MLSPHNNSLSQSHDAQSQALALYKYEDALEDELLALESDLSAFVRAAWHIVEPTTKLRWTWHLDVLCAYLESFARRDITRLIVNVPPGTMKSLLVSVFYPSWIWARDSSHRFVNLTNAERLALRDARRMRDIVTSNWYLHRWDVSLAADQRGIESYGTEKKGFRDAVGFTANITGRRGNTLILDDPHDAKKAFSDLEIRGAIQTYDQAISSRLNDLAHDGIILIMQRLRTNDLSGHLLGKQKQKWVHVCIPMEYEGSPGYDPVRDLGTDVYHGRPLIDPRTEIDELLFPEKFPRDAIEILKEDLGRYGSAGQLQQRPSPMGGGIIKRHWWQIWGQTDDTKDKAGVARPLPTVDHVFVSWDTAYTERDLKEASFSALTAWGVFWHEEKDRYCLLLLKVWWGRVDYPTLRAKAREVENGPLSPDSHLVEKKASGQSLIPDLRRGGIRVKGYDPKPDGDKIGRAALASTWIEQGLVYVPDKPWASKVINYVGDFPAGEPPSGDLTDTVSQAVQFLKRRWWVSHPDDDEPPPEPIIYKDEDEDHIMIPKAGPYG